MIAGARTNAAAASPDAAPSPRDLADAHPPADPRPILVTGGAGFVGTNLVKQLVSDGRRVRILDDLSRPGVEHNADWLRARFGDRIEWRTDDIRDAAAVDAAVADAGGVAAVYHFAAQVAVTTSLDDPRRDFEVNTLGTFNLLEAVRHHAPRVPLLFTSTNKVYGELTGLELREEGRRYVPTDARWQHGVAEAGLDFHSPYGCSKGAADQYVLDYARSFDLQATVFRMSCIYGPHQCGNEDQGWVAHFVRRALTGEPITLFGSGRQVRDVLYVDDLVRAMRLATRPTHHERSRGCAFNVGGGPRYTLSLLELCDQLRQLTGQPLDLNFSTERLGDQRYYVSDIRHIAAELDWRPAVDPATGLRQLLQWMRRELDLPPAAAASGRAQPAAASS